MKELSTAKKFAENSKELYTAFRDYYDHVRSEGGVKGKQFSAKSLDAKEKVINKLFADEIARRSNITVEAYDGDYAHYSINPLVKSFADTISDQMIDMILPETLLGSVGTFAEIRFLDWGDSASFDLENNALFNVSKAGYRQKNASFQKLENTTVTLAPTARQVSVISSLFNILTNRDSIAKYVMKAVRSIESQMLYEAYDALITATAQGTIPTQLYVTNFTKKDAIRLGQTVTSWNGGRQAIFAGTTQALSKILPDATTGGRYMFDSDFVKVGYVDRFAQYDTLEMRQIADYNSTTFGLKLDDNKILVLSPSADKLIKIVVGGTLSHNSGQFENANLAQTGTILKSWETACITNSIAGAIDVTA